MKTAILVLIAIFSVKASAQTCDKSYEIEGIEVAAQLAGKVLRCTEGNGLQLAEIGIRDLGGCRSIIQLQLHGALARVESRFQPALYLDDRQPIKLNRVYLQDRMYHLVGEFNIRPVICVPTRNKWEASHHTAAGKLAAERLLPFLQQRKAENQPSSRGK